MVVAPVAGRILRCGLATVLVASATGCTQFGAHPKCPEEGGSPWFRIESRHLTVLTDQSREDGEATARELEQGLDAITQVAFEHPRSPVEHTTVVLFRESSDFHAFNPRLVGGRFYRHLPNDPEGPRYLVVSSETAGSNRTVLMHELTHDLTDRNFGPAPPWLREGWAEYYSSSRVEDGKVIVGAAPQRITFTEDPVYRIYRDVSGARGLAIPIRVMPAASEIVRMRPAEFYGEVLSSHPTLKAALRAETNYVAAWALVHMFLDDVQQYKKRYQRFLDGAVAGRSLDVAFQEAFGDLPPGRLDGDFRAYAAARELALWQISHEPPARPFALATRRMSDAEVHLLWALLTPWNGPLAESARSDLDAAARAAPAWSDVTFLRGMFHLHRREVDAAERDVGAALRASPDEPRYLLGLFWLRRVEVALKRTGGHESPVDVAERLAGVARTAFELNAAADTLRAAGRPEVAISLAQRAAALEPFDAAILDTLANTLYDLGRVDEAIEVQTAAVAFLDEYARDDGITERLSRYKSGRK